MLQCIWKTFRKRKKPGLPLHVASSGLAGPKRQILWLAPSLDMLDCRTVRFKRRAVCLTVCPSAAKRISYRRQGYHAPQVYRCFQSCTCRNVYCGRPCVSTSSCAPGNSHAELGKADINCCPFHHNPFIAFFQASGPLTDLVCIPWCINSKRLEFGVRRYFGYLNIRDEIYNIPL